MPSGVAALRPGGQADQVALAALRAEALAASAADPLAVAAQAAGGNNKIEEVCIIETQTSED